MGDDILAGYGFRTDLRAHGEIAGIFDRRVVSLELVDPRFYHLDTALTVLDDSTIAYYPPAFSYVSRAHLETLFPEAIVVDTADAYAFGLNAVSDGRHVIHPAAAVGFARQLATQVSSRSVSSCPSCSRVVDPSNAARWRCTRDHSRTPSSVAAR